VKCNTHITDGMSYVVELNANNTYKRHWCMNSCG
jgi:hypothetical protein